MYSACSCQPDCSSSGLRVVDCGPRLTEDDVEHRHAAAAGDLQRRVELEVAVGHEVRRRRHVQAQRAVGARSTQAVNQAGVVGLANSTTQTGRPFTRPSEDVGVGRLRAPGGLRHAERRKLLRAPPRRAGPIAVPTALPSTTAVAPPRIRYSTSSGACKLQVVSRPPVGPRAQRLGVDEALQGPCHPSRVRDDRGRRARPLGNVEDDRACCRSGAPRRADGRAAWRRVAAEPARPRRNQPRARHGTRPSAPRAARLPTRAPSPSASPCRPPARPRAGRTRRRARARRAEAAERSRPRRSASAARPASRSSSPPRAPASPSPGSMRLFTSRKLACGPAAVRETAFLQCRLRRLGRQMLFPCGPGEA